MTVKRSSKSKGTFRPILSLRNNKKRGDQNLTTVSPDASRQAGKNQNPTTSNRYNIVGIRLGKRPSFACVAALDARTAASIAIAGATGK